MKRALSKTVGALAVVYATLSAGLYWAMRQPPDAFGRVMKHVPFPFLIVLPFEPMWKHARAGSAEVGATAPDFDLPMLDHSARVRLSSFRGARPVVLVFGSYT